MRENSFAIKELNPSPTELTQNIHLNQTFSAGYWMMYPEVMTKKVMITAANLIA
jgi:hypothetical protein